MKRYFGLALLLLVGLTTPVFAQQGRGDTDLQLQGNLLVGGDQKDSGSVSALLGRFFTDYQEVGLDVTGNFDTGGDFGGFGGPYYRYNFSTGKVVPYLGIAVASTFGNTFGGTDRLTLVNAEGGARFFVDRQTAFTVSASKIYVLKSKEFDKSITIQFGFSHLWGK